MADITIEELRKLCTDETIAFTQHLQVRMHQRGIHYADVLAVIETGKIIEQYPTDYPYPSCLVLGAAVDKKSIHVVCGVGASRLWVITTYYPSAEKWEPDGKTRKEPKP